MTAMNTDDLIIEIKKFLDELGWSYLFDAETRTFYFRLNVDNDNGTLLYIITVTENNGLAIQAITTLAADTSNKKVMTNLLVFIIQINCLLGFQSGRVDLDVKNGQISYKVFFPMEEMIPSTNIIRYGMYLPAVVWGKIGYGIRMIINGGLSGQAAVELCKDDLMDI